MATPTSALTFQNFYESQLTSDITATATDIFLDTVPNGAQGFLVIEPESPSAREVVFYTSKTGTKVTCPSVVDGRGQDDTTASAHNQGSQVIIAPVAGFFEALQSGAALGAGSITPEKLSSGAATSWALQTWTPTYSNLTVGNGTVISQYTQTGKWIDFIYQLTWGSTSAFTAGSNIAISLPVTAMSGMGAFAGIGIATYNDVSGSITQGVIALENTTTMRPFTITTGGTFATYAQVNNTGPHGWATGDIFTLIGKYPAA